MYIYLIFFLCVIFYVNKESKLIFDYFNVNKWEIT